MEKKGVLNYEVVHEGEETILRIDCEEYVKVPSLEDDPIMMGITCERIAEVGNVSKLIYSQKRDYEYDYDQTQIISEIAHIYNALLKQKNLFSYDALAFGDPTKRFAAKRYSEMQGFFKLLKEDPISAYVKLKRMLRETHLYEKKAINEIELIDEQKYLQLLNYVSSQLERTRLINLSKQYLAGHSVGDREIYRRFFKPTIKPDFMFTKLMANYPTDSEELDSYTVGDSTEVTVFKMSDSVQYLYHLMPPEFRLSEEKYEILDMARKILSEHKPDEHEFTDTKRMRQIFYNVGHDLIEELLENRSIHLTQKEVSELSEILVRYTVGFGLIEVLLADEKIQDITINSPFGRSPMFIVHADFGDCKTNIIPTKSESESWASKLRIISGRPLDEANPILDTEIEIPGANARVGVISNPLNPTGIAYSFRRHRDKPWTLPLFMKSRMINPLAAGLISFLVDGSRTMLVAGTRSAGKSSVLGSLLVELMRRVRIITIEDTLELPVTQLRNLGYNIQQMKVASAMTRGSTEVPADEGIRTTLRLGDSALFVGEVRSTEARALYEAMRVGALANVVAGTIHGDSPFGVYDRVVNDLNVPKTSFKATDIIVVANPIRSPDGLHRWRRITQITEVRKHWEDDPLLEHGFVDLMKYDSKTDELVPTQDLINGDSDILKAIAGNVKEWAGNWDALWDNIILRSKVKEAILKASEEHRDPSLLEAEFVIEANDQFHTISEKIREREGFLDSKKIFFEWNEWMKKAIKKRKLEAGR